MTSTDSLLSTVRDSVSAYCAANHDFSFDPENPVVRLHAGFNELLIAVHRSPGGDTVEGHTFLSTPDRLRHGVVDVGRTRFPWD